jgi:hypothetical protein
MFGVSRFLSLSEGLWSPVQSKSSDVPYDDTCGHLYLDPPSAAQRERSTDIIQHVRRTPVGYAERRFQAFLEEYASKRFKTTWKNPLYGATASLFLDDDNWRALVFV